MTLAASSPTSSFEKVVQLPRPVEPVLAVGAFLKNTVCVTRDDQAFISPVHGDLGTPEAIAAFEASIEAMVTELGVRPVRVAHDIHPDFHCTRFAQSLDLPQVPVQHHHAHAAALAAEHGHMGPVLCLALDGFGLGLDNESWGGELLLADGAQFRRLGHLARLAQPGGDAAAREPWRMASAALHAMGRSDEIKTRFAGITNADMLGRMLERKINCPPTSSAGRLFDAACGLLGVHLIAEFEGQAPMALERMVADARALDGGWRLEDGVLNFQPLLRYLADCRNQVLGAELFHGTLIDGLTHWTMAAAQATGVETVALGGGCFLNKVLTAGLVAALDARGIRTLVAEKVSPGDAGLSLGQAWIATQM